MEEIEELAWASSEEVYWDRRREEHRQQWHEFYRRLEAAHLRLAQENAARAARLLSNAKGES
jgi:hypothetical protein